MGFSDERKDAPQAPDFSAALKKYNEQVADLGVQIKAAQAELTSTQGLIRIAEAAVAETYRTKLMDLEDAIANKQKELDRLMALKVDLDAQIAARELIRDSISNDNTLEQKRLDASWADFHANVAAFKETQAKLDVDRQEYQDIKTAFNSSVKIFNDEQIEAEKTLAARVAAVEETEDRAKVAQSNAFATLQEAKDALDKLERTKADLANQTEEARPILATAEELKRLAEELAIQRKANSAQALRNQQDINEIKVARVALNNQKHDLDARQASLEQAEQKLGGI